MTGVAHSQPKGVEAVAHYVAMRTAAPMNTLGDSVHAIHLATEYEAELRFSDLVLALNSHASLKARAEQAERRVIALEQVISEEMYPENCTDDANRMLLESAIESHDRRIKAKP